MQEFKKINKKTIIFIIDYSATYFRDNSWKYLFNFPKTQGYIFKCLVLSDQQSKTQKHFRSWNYKNLKMDLKR